MTDYNTRDLIIRAQSTPWHSGVEFFAYTRYPQTTMRQVVVGFEFKEVNEGESAGGASFEMTNDRAQELMDDLWHAGLRPTEGFGSAGAIRAVERHLDDYRKLVERFLPTVLGDK